MLNPWVRRGLVVATCWLLLLVGYLVWERHHGIQLAQQRCEKDGGLKIYRTVRHVATCWRAVATIHLTTRQLWPFTYWRGTSSSTWMHSLAKTTSDPCLFRPATTGTRDPGSVMSVVTHGNGSLTLGSGSRTPESQTMSVLRLPRCPKRRAAMPSGTPRTWPPRHERVRMSVGFWPRVGLDEWSIEATETGEVLARYRYYSFISKLAADSGRVGRRW